MTVVFRVVAAQHSAGRRCFVFSPNVTLASDMLKDWQQQKATMVAIADAMPEDKFGYKSTPPQRSLRRTGDARRAGQPVLLGTLGAQDGGASHQHEGNVESGHHAVRSASRVRLRRSVFKEFNDAAWTQAVWGRASSASRHGRGSPTSR